MPFNKTTASNNNNFTKKVNTVKGTRVNTARPKAVLSAVKGNKGNAVKASACWVWRPKHKILDHVSRNNGASMSFKRFDYIDAQGRSKSVTVPILLDRTRLIGDLLPLEVIPKEGKLLGKSLDFKLTDESHVLLKGPRKDNMYNGYSRMFVPKESVSYQALQQTLDEFFSRKPALSFMRPFGCPVTILNTIDHLGKFDGKADEGFFVGYSTNSKAFRVKLEWRQYLGGGKKDAEDPGNEGGIPGIEEQKINQEKDASVNSTNNINTVSPTVNAASIEDNVVDENIVGCADDPNIPELEDIV
ncbi:hypothetical protein Tco_0503549 [Tanacetum coccineum]